MVLKYYSFIVCVFPFSSFVSLRLTWFFNGFLFFFFSCLYRKRSRTKRKMLFSLWNAYYFCLEFHKFKFFWAFEMKFLVCFIIYSTRRAERYVYLFHFTRLFLLWIIYIFLLLVLIFIRSEEFFFSFFSLLDVDFVVCCITISLYRRNLNVIRGHCALL